MQGLSFGLKVRNEKQVMNLMLDKDDDGRVFFTLVGNHNGELIQIDFDEINTEDAHDLANMIRTKADS